jgi:fatty acid-binding protein DegV
MTRKRKKVYITTESTCDIPEEYRERLDIKVADLYIQTKYGRFRESEEIDVNNLSHYLSDKESYAESYAASVEEYERFFAETLTEADEVIYIAMASFKSRCFESQ